MTFESCSLALESERLNHWTTGEVPHLVLDALQSDRVHKVSLVLLSCHDSLKFYNCPQFLELKLWRFCVSWHLNSLRSSPKLWARSPSSARSKILKNNSWGKLASEWFQGEAWGGWRTSQERGMGSPSWAGKGEATLTLTLPSLFLRGETRETLNFVAFHGALEFELSFFLVLIKSF